MSIGGGNVNYGIGSDTTWGLMDRLRKYGSITNGLCFLIKIGCNDFKYDTTPEDVVGRISYIAEMLPVGSKIIVSSQLPVGKTIKDETLHAKLRKVNELSRNLVREKGYIFLDSYSVLCGTDGFLNPDYDFGDGVHLNDIGNTVWTRKMNELFIKGQ